MHSYEALTQLTCTTASLSLYCWRYRFS